jgi:hypothetical protein
MATKEIRFAIRSKLQSKRVFLSLSSFSAALSFGSSLFFLQPHYIIGMEKMGVRIICPSRVDIPAVVHGLLSLARIEP